ncbi:MAG: hypothetical protein EBZ48_17820 [Proteobacteria bacterium]|nr:hypothetical protein [Pseudomonadota bacterium]
MTTVPPLMGLPMGLRNGRYPNDTPRVLEFIFGQIQDLGFLDQTPRNTSQTLKNNWCVDMLRG